MINYTFFELPNGLRVVHHEDVTTELCVVNILYDVGSKHEDENKTGFAHLFEHLMFGGSVNIPEFDTPLQLAGGENNAFTNHDITNYYITLPAPNIETAFWLESDRMLSLAFSPQSLEIQRSVVIEEYKERYLNQPYGDVWLKLLPLAYQQHPYKWPTIGKAISHIEQATMEDVKAFFHNFYNPANAILVVAGNIALPQTKELAEKWFGPIERKTVIKPKYVPEPIQKEARTETVYANVPADLLVKAYHTVARTHPDYYATDLLSDLLGAGKSARLYIELVKNQQLFSELDCYLTGDIEPGLLVIEGKLAEGVSVKTAEQAIETLLIHFCEMEVNETELVKVKNKSETSIRFNDIGVLNKAMKLAYACVMGDLELVNKETEYYQAVTSNDILRVAKSIFSPSNCSTLYYLKSTHGTA